jgi:hypothetical protein
MASRYGQVAHAAGKYGSMRWGLAVLLAISACASWRTRDIVLEGVVVGGIAADAATTIRGMNQGRNEMNPVLGSHPDATAVVTFGASVALLHVGIAVLLKDDWRLVWQATWIGAESTAVMANLWTESH